MKESDVQSVLEDIAKIVTQFSDKTFLKNANGDVLSYIAVRLAALKASLLDTKVDYHMYLLTKERELETAKGKAYAKFKATDGATAAGDMKNTDPDYIKAKEEHSEAKVNFEKIKSVVSDTHDLIDSIKSRVIDMQGARRDERG